MPATAASSVARTSGGQTASYASPSPASRRDATPPSRSVLRICVVLAIDVGKGRTTPSSIGSAHARGAQLGGERQRPRPLDVERDVALRGEAAGQREPRGD